MSYTDLYLRQEPLPEESRALSHQPDLPQQLGHMLAIHAALDDATLGSSAEL